MKYAIAIAALLVVLWVMRRRTSAPRGERDVGNTWEARVARLEVLGTEEQEERLELWRALIADGGAAVLVDRWRELPATARMGFLEGAAETRAFELRDVLPLARRGMDDEVEAVARRAFKTYAYAVTHALETRPAGFDPLVWIDHIADDLHPDVQKLRAGLAARLERAAEAKGVSTLVSQYRENAFREARPTRVRIELTREHVMESEDGVELRLAAGLREGKLSGTFDNAQNAVQAGWSLVLELEDDPGSHWTIESTWDAQELFAELLDARHDAGRAEFEEAPADLRQALGLHAFVGPIVTWGDAWDELHPRLAGEVLELAGEQLVSALVSTLPREEAGTELVFLLYEIEVEDEDGDRDEAPPFMVRLALEDLIMDAGLENSCRVRLGIGKAGD